MNAPVWQQQWAGLSAREKQGVTLAAAAVGLLLLWFVAIAPAVQTWQRVPAQRQALEGQWLQMQRMATDARELKGQPPVSAEQSTQALKAATERLGGKAKLAVQGERATLTLTGANTDQLQAWLSEVRSGARARPVDVQLRRNATGLEGQVVVSLARAGG
jgi:general secretion pathway protein M